jgi:hypothetical protein
MARSDTDQSTQGLDNRSFNDDFAIYENLVYGHDPVTDTVKALRVDSNGNLLNAGFSADADITTDLSTPGVIIQTDGVKTYTATITPTQITEEWT